VDETEHYRMLELTEQYNEELEKNVEIKTKQIRFIQEKTILGMAQMVESRDGNTGGHIMRTSDVVHILLEVITENHLMDLKEEFKRDLTKAAPMHDLGKIAISDNILQKPARFTDAEFEIMKSHASESGVIVEKILRGIEEDHFVNIAYNVARHHHEKWNGTGYPDGLSGESIPLEARIMAIADVYDALVSKRCYKESLSFKEAEQIMLESMGTHFDPAMKPVFELGRERLEAYYKKAM